MLEHLPSWRLLSFQTVPNIELSCCSECSENNGGSTVKRGQPRPQHSQFFLDSIKEAADACTPCRSQLP